MRFHRFDAPEDLKPAPCPAAPATIAQAERAFHSSLYLRAQHGAHYSIFRGRQ